MYKLILLLKCVVLAKSDNIQGSQSWPLISYQQNYVQPEIPVVIQSYSSPYQQQVLVQNQLASSYTNYLSDQIKRLLLEKVLSSPIISSLVDGNDPDLQQNDNDIPRFIKPSESQPNIVNNYIIVPAEYVDLNPNDKICHYNAKDARTRHKTKNLMDDNNLNVKSSYQHQVEKKSTNTNLHRGTAKKTDKITSNDSSKNDKGHTQRKLKKKLKSSTKKKEDILQPSMRSKDKLSKTKVRDINTEKDKKQSKTKVNDCDDCSKRFETDNTKSERKLKSPHKDKESEYLISRKKSERLKKTADVQVCFDINEDCTDLECRRTRNNNYEPKKNIQQQFPKEFTDNIVSYMNNVMSNQQFNPNFFNPNTNYPYNFDYIYQIPQQSNESSNRRRNRRKKQRSNNNRNQNKNKNHEEPKVSDDSIIEVELTPQFIEIEELATEPIVKSNTKITSKTVETQTDKIERTDTKANVDNFQVSQPISETYKILASSDELNEISSNKIPTLHQRDFIPFFNDNDILDDYYPDFTADNFYFSKEDYEFNNINDRHYYSSDNKAGTSRDKRKYERVGKRLDEHNNPYKTSKDNKIDTGHKDHIDGKFRSPPALEFPDFKTVMVNKDTYVPKSEIYYEPNIAHENYKRIDHDIKRSYSIDSEDFDTGVETVFAHSKVAKYSPPAREERLSLFDSREVNKNNEENLISRHGDTTVVIAKSLGYLNDY